jgi:hypothetical protein
VWTLTDVVVEASTLAITTSGEVVGPPDAPAANVQNGAAVNPEIVQTMGLALVHEETQDPVCLNMDPVADISAL